MVQDETVTVEDY